ncbi:preprotein translocase subunit SecY [Candidatus Giovannonibacteria bacterium RIFCSPLOWO2_12_FULL_44_25]|uniref:Protein translocase subunit SecY n=3 Tax=Parcubacteria group TaxID=1794811 RepID=A0A837IIL3_9BACT|nr:MAG: preprotein translocase, SecY subunit, preprotein translocase subunit SecY [Parcubacteria group bacterium GW2011_GWC1_44_10]KKT60161.1 MAG: Protein translocase subunit SecY [Candidatus Giovannonibacteria bacterium GW2011_GWA1_44_25]KKU12368.1 MAG: Protein translocase subunit SecY [Candidatus Azambacteria bacterium GW2011_GWC2_45_7b]KKU30008.1 MAG: Protein translocase subunit SecY [Candidatus Giovannonibacteria bacterium GW2011_GWB1_46_20]OGF49366.1 MAG: preprotein translocase subunit Sec
MWEKFKLILKDIDLRRKFLYVLGFLAIFRLISSVPIPGIDAEKLRQFFEANQFFGLLNLFSGGALGNLSIMMLGVGPYITASIIMQLLTMLIPALKELQQEEGEAGRQKFNQYSRMLTVPLALVQGFGLLTILERQGILQFLTFYEKFGNMIIVAAGSILLMWIGELISEYGIGNGVSLLIFAGIVARLPSDFRQTVIAFDPSQLPTLISFFVIAVVTVAAVVYISEGDRPIPVYYAKRIRGMRMYGGTTTYLPLKVNQAGVIPIIFALSILLLPQMVANFFTASSSAILRAVAAFVINFLGSSWAYAAAYFILVFLFTYFYTAVTFDPQAVSKNLQQSGAFVPGIRPGASTAEFLSKIVTRITFVGALFLGAVAVLPIVVQGFTGIATLTIGGTALLIVVSVVLETAKQVEGQLSLRAYE